MWRDVDEGSFMLKSISPETVNRWKSTIEKLLKENATRVGKGVGLATVEEDENGGGFNPRSHRSLPIQANTVAGPERNRQTSDGNLDPYRSNKSNIFTGVSLKVVLAHGSRNLSIGQLSAVIGGDGKQTGLVKIKINYQEDVYQILVPNQISFEQLMSKLEKKILMCGGIPEGGMDSLRVRYIDEDGDHVTIKTDEDVLTSFEGRDSSIPHTVLNLYVSEA